MPYPVHALLPLPFEHATEISFDRYATGFLGAVRGVWKEVEPELPG